MKETLRLHTKRKNFERLAESRIKKILDAIRVFEHLNNKAIYEYAEADVVTIKETLEAAILRCVDKFTPQAKPETLVFKFMESAADQLLCNMVEAAITDIEFEKKHNEDHEEGFKRQRTIDSDEFKDLYKRVKESGNKELLGRMGKAALDN